MKLGQIMHFKLQSLRSVWASVLHPTYSCAQAAGGRTGTPPASGSQFCVVQPRGLQQRQESKPAPCRLLSGESWWTGPNLLSESSQASSSHKLFKQLAHPVYRSPNPWYNNEELLGIPNRASLTKPFPRSHKLLSALKGSPQLVLLAGPWTCSALL